MTKTTTTILLSILSILLSYAHATTNDTHSANTSSCAWQLQHQIKGKTSLRASAIKGDSIWVSGTKNSVFVSQNRGITWRDISVMPTDNLPDTDFRDIALFNSNTAIVMGVGSGAESRLYKTSDGGTNWSLLYQNSDKEGFFDAIAFWDEQNGLLMGDPVDGYYLVKRTTDGGKTWRRISINNLPLMNENEGAFAASGNTLIVGKQGKAWLTTGGFSASVYVSTDFGESWSRQAVPLYDVTETSGGYGLALNTNEQVFVVGGNYKDRNSRYANMATFAQNKWHQVSTGQNGLRTAMTCQKATCITTGKNASDISFDNGLTWEALSNQNYSEHNKGFYTLASDKGLFIAAGADGKVALFNSAECNK